MASTIALYPLRRRADVSVNHMMLMNNERTPENVQKQKAAIFLLPQELLHMTLKHICANASAKSKSVYSLGGLHSLALLSRVSFHLHHDVSQFGLAEDTKEGQVSRIDDQWLIADKNFFQKSLASIKLCELGVEVGQLVIVRDCVLHRSTSAHEGSLLAPRIYLHLYKVFEVGSELRPNVFSDDNTTVQVLELDLQDALRFFNTSLEEAKAPDSGNAGELWACSLDKQFPESSQPVDVHLHGPAGRRPRGRARQNWWISTRSTFSSMPGEYRREFDLDDDDVEFLKSFFNSDLPDAQARCRYGIRKMECFLPIVSYGEYGGDISPENVMPDGRRRNSVIAADQTTGRFVDELRKFDADGRLVPGSAEYDQLRAEAAASGLEDDRIAMNDDNEYESDKEEGDGGDGGDGGEWQAGGDGEEDSDDDSDESDEESDEDSDASEDEAWFTDSDSEE